MRFPVVPLPSMPTLWQESTLPKPGLSLSFSSSSPFHLLNKRTIYFFQTIFGFKEKTFFSDGELCLNLRDGQITNIFNDLPLREVETSICFSYPIQKVIRILFTIQLTIKPFRQSKKNAKITPLFTCLCNFFQCCKLFLYNQLSACMI